MPRSLDPAARFPLVLDYDAAQPAETRPTFYFRSLSGRETIEAANEADSLRDGKNAGAIESFYVGLRRALVNWEHVVGRDGVEIAYDPAKLPDVLEVDEAGELLTKLNISLADKKKSDSQP